MAENEETPAATSSGDPNFDKETAVSPTLNDPPAVSEEREEKEEHEEGAEGVCQQTKKRKLCPSGLEFSPVFNGKNHGFSEELSIPGFSFSFDAKSTAIESTPKFGSFNFTTDLDLSSSSFAKFSFGSEEIPEKGSGRREVDTTVVETSVTAAAGSIVVGASMTGASVQSGEED